MQTTSRGQRLHIGIFGLRNAGKSSLINALTGQETALVSDVAGTTTDPVYKSMEILPIGPVVIIDTAGLDDSGDLGTKRVKKSLDVLKKTDLAIVVMDITDLGEEIHPLEKDIVWIKEQKVPVLLVLNKSDLGQVDVNLLGKISSRLNVPVITCSARTGEGIDEVKQGIIDISSAAWHEPSLLGDIVREGEIAILVTPIDDAAPKGRLILPQVQSIRDILDNDALCMVVKERELTYALRSLKEKPRIVITDSQAFQKVAADTPPDVLMTSFSILFARYKGDLEAFIKGVNRIKTLKDGEKVLIAEACTHHVQSDDIGTVKIPRWIRQLTGKDIIFEKVSGIDFPENLDEYALILHCGSCMLNRREVLNRVKAAGREDIPITNYGMAIAYCFGILERALKPFPLALSLYHEDLY